MLLHSLRRGGAERIALELALGMKGRGHEVEIATWVDIDEYYDVRYVDVRRYYLIPKRDYRWIASIPKSSAALRKVVDRFQPDVIVIHSPNMAWLAAWANTGVPCIHVLHGYGTLTRESGLAALVVRQISRLAARRLATSFVTVSNSMREVAAKFFNVNIAEISAIPNGVNLDSFPFHGNKPSGHFNILMLGTLCHNKGQRLGILAFRKILDRFPEARLSIVGDGEDKESLKALTTELGMEASVSMPGRRDDITTVFAESDLLWQLSESEAMPMVVLESMASGVPVVGFNVNGTRDAVADCETGYLVPYGDIEAIAERSSKLLTSPIDYRRLAKNCRVRTERYFTYELFLQSHELLVLHKGKLHNVK